MRVPSQMWPKSCCRPRDLCTSTSRTPPVTIGAGVVLVGKCYHWLRKTKGIMWPQVAIFFGIMFANNWATVTCVLLVAAICMCRYTWVWWMHSAVTFGVLVLQNPPSFWVEYTYIYIYTYIHTHCSLHKYSAVYFLPSTVQTHYGRNICILISITI